MTTFVQNGQCSPYRICYYSTVSAKRVKWLWEPYIPFGKITVVQGDPGDGKTTLVLDIAARLSVGRPMPDGENSLIQGKIIYQNAEDGADDTLKPRLIEAGADCSNIAFIDESDDVLSVTSPRLENAICEMGAKMLVLDPLQAYLGDGGEMNRADGIRPAMKHLAGVAERTGCAIVIIGHMNKANGAKGIYRGLGSIDIVASARSVLLVGRIRSNPSIRVLAQLKNSLAQEGSAIAFEISDKSTLRWIGEYDISIDELLSGDTPLEDSGKLDQAVEIMRTILYEESTACADIYGLCREAGIGKRTVDSAKKQLGVKSIKRSDGWYWELPKR